MRLSNRIFVHSETLSFVPLQMNHLFATPLYNIEPQFAQQSMVRLHNNRTYSKDASDCREK